MSKPLSRGGCALLVVVLLGLAGRQLIPDQSLPLSAIPSRPAKNLLAPSEPCAQDENFPFLTSDFVIAQKPGQEKVLIATAPALSRIRMHLQSPESLQVGWTLRFLNGMEERIQWSVNDHPWIQTDVSTSWRKFQAELPGSLLRPGMNELRMRMPIYQQLAFGHWRFASEFEAPAALEPDLTKDNLLVQLGAPLSFAVHSQGLPVLEADLLESGQKPGVAAMPDLRLKVSLRNPGTYWEKIVPADHRAFRCVLPYSSSGYSRLQLEALGPKQPLPGQLGIALSKPRLRVKSAPSPEPERPASPSPQSGQKPPVILYLIDTLRADHLGCYGYSPSPSPQLDRFAQDSVRFEDCSAQSGWTKPSTASILSSQWPWGHGVQDFADHLPKTVPWLPQILHERGYQTAAVATNCLAGPDFGYDRGYDSFTMASRTTSEVAHQECLKWLQKSDLTRPFFLYIHTLDPHSPYLHSTNYRGWDRAVAQEADDEPLLLNDLADGNRLRGRDNHELMGRIQRRLKDYDFEIANNDASFGKLVSWLKEHQIYDRAMIIVVSDHGEEFLEHGKVGHVNSVYQELLHVPLLVKFPQQQWGGTVVHSTWQQVDIAPTILAACGLDIPKEFQGRPYLGREGEPQRLSLFSVQAGRFTLKRQTGIDALFNCIRGVRQGSWVYQRVLSGAPGRFDPEELYDLAADPNEQKNLADQDPGRALTLALLFEPHFHSVFQSPPSDAVERKKLLEMLRSLQYMR